MLLDSRLTLKYKTYSIKLQDDELEEWKEHIVVGTVARPVLASIAGSLGSKLLGSVTKKNFWREKKKI